MSLFIRFTLLAAAAIVGLFVLAFLLKIFLIAGILAGIAFGGVLAFKKLRHKFEPPVAFVRRG